MNSVKETRLSDESLHKAAECLRVIAHPARLRMIELLAQERLNVGQLAEACEIPHNQASEHLRLMLRCGFLNMEREGRASYYSIGESTLTDIMGCIERRFRDAA